MSDSARELRQRLEEELTQSAPAAAEALAGEIRARLGDSVAAVLFYGSCLRRRTVEGVLDFYVLVDDYERSYASRSRWLARLNAWLPPNVFYLELETRAGPLRCKYAVLSLADFERATAGGWLRPGIWARFCQPALAIDLRDVAARARVVEGASRSLLTALATLLPLDPASDGSGPFDTPAFWRRAFAATYGYEMRPEREDAIAGLLPADPQRYRATTRAALRVLAARGELTLDESGEALRVTLPPAERSRAARRWRRRRPLAKLAYAAALLKTAFTFGDWLPYALFKLQRHTGTRIVPSERQRRHPLIWGWPLLWRVLRQRALR